MDIADDLLDELLGVVLVLLLEEVDELLELGGVTGHLQNCVEGSEDDLVEGVLDEDARSVAEHVLDGAPDGLEVVHEALPHTLDLVGAVVQCPLEHPLEVRLLLAPEVVHEAQQCRLAVARPDVVRDELGLQVQDVLLQLVRALHVVQEVVQAHPHLVVRQLLVRHDLLDQRARLADDVVHAVDAHPHQSSNPCQIAILRVHVLQDLHEERPVERLLGGFAQLHEQLLEDLINELAVLVHLLLLLLLVLPKRRLVLLQELLEGTLLLQEPVVHLHRCRHRSGDHRLLRVGRGHALGRKLDLLDVALHRQVLLVLVVQQSLVRPVLLRGYPGYLLFPRNQIYLRRRELLWSQRANLRRKQQRLIEFVSDQDVVLHVQLPVVRVDDARVECSYYVVLLLLHLYRPRSDQVPKLQLALRVHLGK